MTQPDIENAVAYALAQSGKPYHSYGARFGPDYYDCSGLVIASLRHAGIPVPDDVGNTVGLYNWAKRVGGLITVSKGVSVRGAIMIKGKNYGYGPLGHTSFSLGDGREMAAHGTYSGIHVSDLYGGRNYQDAFIIPGVFYKSLQPPVDPKVIELLLRLEAWKTRVSETPLHLGDTSNDVTILNELLIHRSLMDRDHQANTYTKWTRGGVYRLKHGRALENQDGKVFGADAAYALLNPA